MFRFPFYGYPQNHFYNGYNNLHIQNKKIEEKKSITNSNETSNTSSSSKFDFSPDQAIFEIFGIKLFFDDLIILGLLFFLYQQKVKDELLYIILFLLLFS